MRLQNLDAFAPWINEIKYNNNRWVAQLHPGAVIEAWSFESLTEMMAAHTVNEITHLVAEIVGSSEAKIKSKGQARELCDARHIVVYIMCKNFKIPIALTAKAVGYSTHVAVYNAINNVENVLEVNNKLQKLYRAYPWLVNSVK